MKTIYQDGFFNPLETFGSISIYASKEENIERIIFRLSWGGGGGADVHTVMSKKVKGKGTEPGKEYKAIAKQMEQGFTDFLNSDINVLDLKKFIAVYKN